MAAARNRLLAALSDETRHRLLGGVEICRLVAGEVLYEPHAPVRHIHFPVTATISLHYTMENGRSAEMATVGCDGVVGISVFMGGGRTSNRAVVQIAGDCLRLRSERLRDALDDGDDLRRVLLLYSQALLTQMSQTAVCNRLHSVDQQLCRCLLLCLDRSHSDRLALTQEAIANVLGVRREGVSIAANRLQTRGVIRYSRGHITIRDRHGLEAGACECYQVVKLECDRLLPERPAVPTVIREPSARHLGAAARG